MLRAMKPQIAFRIISILALPLSALAQDAVTAETPNGKTAAPSAREPATVFFTHDISPEGLAYKLVSPDGTEPPSTKRVD